MIIEEINSSSPPENLTEFVRRHNLLFNSQKWLSCYDSKCIRQCVVMNNNREIIGSFVYYLFKKAGFRFVITPPFTPDISLFFVNPAESTVGKNSFVKELMSALSNYFSGLQASYINLNLPAYVSDSQPMIWDGYLSRTRYTYQLELDVSEEVLWKNLSPEKRKSIAKAQKDRLQIKPSGDADLVYSLVQRSLARNAKNKNLEVLKKILRNYCGTANATSFVAFAEEKALAATFCLIEGKKAIYLFGGYDSESKHHGAGVSCMWAAIKEAKQRGLQIFDFEGSMDKKIERYFREFGPDLVPYQCAEKIKPLLKLLLKFKGHEPL